ncbi:hypothetical protein PN464_14320 [Nodularia sphaerocarpa CS-585]|nr:hypothetical protein [Nodularia sphaerocarpa]MDB9374551.1 hypothetical protein [Nodularia sphaerocarpa CS-585]MDB9377834.1 hypothetical protein [Nodularia sphaerocarpa CS-585A2]
MVINSFQRPPDITPDFTQLPCDSEDFSAILLQKTPTKWGYGYEYHGNRDENNQFTGQAILIFPDGNRYYGEFKNGKRHGCGKVTYPPNDQKEYYLGQFENDKADGLGTIKWRDGREYRGEFKDHQCEGKGTLQFPNKRSVSGLWQKGTSLLNSDIKCE